MDIKESLKARIMQSSVNGEHFVPIPMNEVNEILSTIRSLEAERDKYKEALTEVVADLNDGRPDMAKWTAQSALKE